jgi:hypothetical protein
MRRVAQLVRVVTLSTIVGLPLGAAAIGCVEINGGAVEASWAIFARDGRAISDCRCSDPGIAYVRVDLDGESHPCDDKDACRFSCDRKVGATPFMIPPGQYLISLVPVGADGMDLPAGSSPGEVQWPAAESRTVVRGQPTDLEAFMLESSCAASCDRGSQSPCSGG